MLPHVFQRTACGLCAVAPGKTLDDFVKHDLCVYVVPVIRVHAGHQDQGICGLVGLRIQVDELLIRENSLVRVISIDVGDAGSPVQPGDVH